VAEPDSERSKGLSAPRPSTGPAVQHLVVRYAKRGKMRFASHRDVARAFERGVRRAGLPIAYSAGFTPHPKISYAGGAPTGVASEAEYLSLALTSRQAATQVRLRLNAVLPDGIDVIDVTDDAGGDGKPGSGASPSGGLGLGLGQLEASRWQVVLPGVTPAAAEQAVAGFLALGEAQVERLTDKGVRSLDARAAVLEMTVLQEAMLGVTVLQEAVLQKAVPPKVVLEEDVLEARPPAADPPYRDGGERAAVTGQEDKAILRMVILHTTPAVRPDDILTALRMRHGIAPSSPPLTTRLAQGSRAMLAGKEAS
jgi:radical SAM-linked protein